MAERFMGVAIMQTIVDSAVIRSMPIRQRIDWLMDHARRHSVGFQSPESFLARSLYTAQHQTAVVALKCMDGRLNLSVATGTPAGIIEANMQYRRIPDDGFLLLAESLYHEIGIDRARAELKSGFYGRICRRRSSVKNIPYLKLRRCMCAARSWPGSRGRWRY